MLRNVCHCHARAAISNNAKNLDALNDADEPGRGIGLRSIVAEPMCIIVPCND
ncbi:MAG: hypothetical protein ACKVIK_16090 [Rhodospirillales bacterium]